jgi:uncharacterized protein (TIGR02217 family)
MALVVLADVIFPTSIIAAGVKGKNMRLNERVSMDSGQEQINIVWTQTLRQFELGTVPLRIDQWQTIETLHEITDGGAYGMLLEDPKDNTVTFGVVKANPDGTRQLFKRYLDPVSGRYKDRKITRPRLTGLSLKQSGVEYGGAYTIDPLTGKITISTDITTLTWTGRFYVPVHFMDDSIDWQIDVAGPYDARLTSGPNVMLQEVRE